MSSDASGAAHTRRALRRDARANQDRILDAAAQLIARDGASVPLAAIAESAGVGIGTLYRGFPDRAALLAALQARALDLLEEILGRIAAAGMSGRAAVETYLVECLAVADHLILPLRGHAPLTDRDALRARGRIVAGVEAMLAAGRADGSIRPDVTAMDVIVCASMITQPLNSSLNWPLTARRHIAVFLRGIGT